jgi:hypothetical protein
MHRNRLLLGAGALALLGIAGPVALLIPRPGAGITRENYERIGKGMTEAEVEDALGCPPGDYTGGRYAPPAYLPAGVGLLIPDLNDPDFKWPKVAQWVGQDLAIEVWFAPDDRVAVAVCREVFPVPGWLHTRLRRWLSW